MKKENNFLKAKMNISTFFKNNKALIIKCVIIVLILAFILYAINIGLIISDVICRKTGYSLTAKGLYNNDWLVFWKDYCSISVAFIGVYLVWNSSNKDRKIAKQKELINYQMSELSKEEAALVQIVESIDIGIVYNAICKLVSNKCDINDALSYLVNSRDKVDNSHIKFELLTDISVDYENGECAESNRNIDVKKLKNFRDKYYKLEKEYLELIDFAENYVRENGLVFMGEESNYKNKDDLDYMVKYINKKTEILNKDRAEFIRFCKGYIDLKKKRIYRDNFNKI